MHRLIFVLAVAMLGACETFPEFAQPASAEPAQPAAIAPAAPPARFTPPPEQQLLELERQLQAAAQERGLGAALGGAIDPDDGMVIRPGAAYQGAQAIEQGLAAPAGAGAMYWQPDRVHVSSAGDMGLTSGRYVQVVAGAEAVQGRYLIVWRRASGGEWKVLTETRVADPPRARPRRR